MVMLPVPIGVFRAEVEDQLARVDGGGAGMGIVPAELPDAGPLLGEGGDIVGRNGGVTDAAADFVDSG